MTPQPTESSVLDAIGASLAEWNAHHDADPGNPGWYLPAATDAPDRYTNLTCSADGRVTSYTMNFKPPLTAGEADQILAAELPRDASRNATTGQTNCETRVYASRLLAAALPSSDPDGIVTATLRSFVGSDLSVQVYTILIAATTTSGC